VGKTVVEFDEESRRQLAKAIYTKDKGLYVSPKVIAHFP
jgi:ribosomal protein S6